MENKINDIAIIGMGPAGCAAAIYLKRSGINPFCFEEKQAGGKLNQIKEIENYPSFVGTGSELAEKLRAQLDFFKISVIGESVRSISRDYENGFFSLKTDKGAYEFKSIIIATGIRN